MAWQYGLLFNNADEFIRWLQDKDHSKHPEVHVHHTYDPSHADFNGKNHRALQDGMRNYHINHNGWSDIGQHVTVFPDGKVMTGRDINMPPASARGYNDEDPDGQHPFMFEMLGNFDLGHDKLQGAQLESAVKLARYFYQKGATIRFHRQCLIHGKEPKTCPGTGIDYNWFCGLVKSNPAPAPKPAPKPTPKPAPVPKYPGYPIKRGMKGEVVKMIQRKLGGLVVDGIFGAKTEAKVKAFQKSKGLVVDGIVGPKTWNALFN